MKDFAEIPGEIAWLLGEHDRVALILLDALGLRFLERHDTHPFVRRLDVAPLRTQFPSTTTAHLTTVAFGAPVREHGLYEWVVWEPSLARMIIPILVSNARAIKPGGLLQEGFQIDRFAPGPTLYRRLGVPAAVLRPARIAHSPWSDLTSDGADSIGFDDIADGARKLAQLLADPHGPRYAHLYWDEIDTTGHLEGPSSQAFAAAAEQALDALERAFFGPGAPAFDDVLLLLTADHGQIDTGPARVDYVDELWPQLGEHLAVTEPAGSARDLFLHTKDGRAEEVIAGLSGVLGDRARVVATSELFPEPGPRLAQRLADVCVLPVTGRMAWMRSAASVEQRFLGHHGGLDDAETATYLAAVHT